MNRIKFVLLAAVCLTAMVFTSCGGVDDEDGPAPSGSSSSDGGSPPGVIDPIDPDIPCEREYDRLTEFCFGGKVWDRCGNEEYDPNTRFCFEDKFYLKCNGLKYPEYNPLLEFCSGNKLYLRCNGKERDPENEFCFDGKTVVPKCADEIFNPDEQFCLSRAHLALKDTLIAKCGGNEFYPDEQFCGKDAKLYTKCFVGNTDPNGKYGLANSCCAGTLINNRTHFCFEEERRSLEKCNGETYHPKYEFPKGTGVNCTIEKLCDGREYNTSTHFCSKNDKINQLCGNLEYDPLTEFCGKNNANTRDSVITKCGGSEYAVSDKFCSDGETVAFCGTGTNKKEYNPDNEFCGKNYAGNQDSVITKCDGSIYTFSEAFCRGGKSYPRCGTTVNATYGPKSYNPLDTACCGSVAYRIDSKFCFEEEKRTEDLCNGKPYNPPSDTCAADRINPSQKRIYQKLCGGEIYDYSKRFCSGNRFYLLCDKEEYNPLTYFCYRETIGGVTTEKLYPRCGGNEKENPENEFCFDGKLILLCGTAPNQKEYNPDEEVCDNGVLNPKEKCGGNDILSSEFCSAGKPYPRCYGNNTDLTGWYSISSHSCCYESVFNIATEFCFEEEKRSYPKCGTTVKIAYNPSTHFCGLDDETHQICGGNYNYDYTNKFCSSDKLYSKCAGGEYDPIKDFCYKDPTNPSVDIGPRLRCGGKEYDLAREFCFDGKIYTKCDNYNREYNPETQFCFQDEIKDMCGGLQYTPSEQGCHRGIKIYEKCGTSRADYNPDNQLCFNSKIYSTNCSGFTEVPEFCDGNTGYSLCGKNSFNVGTEFCSGGVIRKKCADYSRKYDPSTEFCSTNRDEVRDLCQVAEYDNLGNIIKFSFEAYDTDEKQCDLVKYAIVDKGSDQGCGIYNPNTHYCCFGQTYPKSDGYFCDKNERYPECFDPDAYLLDPELLDPSVPLINDPAYINHISQKREYIPADYICYQGGLKPSCSSPKLITGPCAYSNSLLRCKQLGDGFDYVRDPLPGMECQSNGAIISKPTSAIQTNVGYPIAQIGRQIWIAENLKVNPAGSWAAGSSCEGSGTNCDGYGHFYDWAAAMKTKNYPTCNKSKDNCPDKSEDDWQFGICPNGFLIPTLDDWRELINYAGGAKIAAGRLKASTSGIWIDGDGTDDYGFNAKPGGYGINWGTSLSDEVLERDYRSIWWTSDPYNAFNAYYIDMISADTEVRTHYRLKDGGAYVRCVRYGAF